MKLWRERIKIIKLIWLYICEYKVRLGMLFFLKCGQGIPILMTPLLFKLLIDRVIEQKNFGFMSVVAMLFILLYVFETVLKVVHRYLDNHMFNEITAKLRKIIWKNCLYLSYSKFKEYEISELSKRINDDIDMVKFFMVGEVFDYLTYAVSLVAGAIAMLFIDWKIAIIFLMFLPVSVFLSYRFQSQLGELHENERVLSSKVHQWIRYSLNSWKEVKANNLEQNQSQIYEKLLRQQYESEKKRSYCVWNRNCVLDIKNLYIDEFLLFIIGGIMHFFYRSTIGSVLACIQYYNGMIRNLGYIIEINTNLEWVKPSIFRAVEMLSFTVDCNEETHPADKQEGYLYQIAHLNYKYPDSKQTIFTDFNLEINIGEKLLIQGVSGRGKSTLIQLLTKNLLAESGFIYFYEKNIKEIDQSVIYSGIRVVHQHPYYMNISIGEYLRLAKAAATNEELEEACKKACIMEYIASLTHGFDHVMGVKGERLSGGQKQKLALARLFLVQHKTILLDEAFSAIDGKHKTLILKSIMERFEHNTIVCVTHDQDLEPFFHRIITIDG